MRELESFVSVIKPKKKDLLKMYGSDTDGLIERLRAAGERGYLTLEELFEIRKEKSSRNAREVENNREEDVQWITWLAFQSESEWTRISLLTSLRGVAVPTASAILSWTYPEWWGVIDQRAWRTLYRAGLVKSKPEGIGLGNADWCQYVEYVDYISNELRITPQRVDKLLYGLDKEYQDKVDN